MCANSLHLPVRATSCRLRNRSVSCFSHPTPLQHICDMIRKLLEWINGNLTPTCLANCLTTIKCLACISRYTEHSAPNESVLYIWPYGSAADNSPKVFLRYHEGCILDAWQMYSTSRWPPPPVIFSVQIRSQMLAAEKNGLPSIRIGIVVFRHLSEWWKWWYIEDCTYNILL